MSRVIVFGLDGGEPSLLYPWAAAGHLPNLKRVMDAGCVGRLESTIHPLTPQAWTSMVTGVNPGRHGIFDFGARREGAYHIDLVTSADRRFPTIFEHLPEPLRAGVINVPLSFPVDPIRGFAIGGMHTPTLATPGATHQPDLAAHLSDWGYVIDVMVHWYEDVARFLDDVRAMLAKRHEIALRLFDEQRPDLFFPVYVALDRVQHALWTAMTSAHRREPGVHGGLGDAIFETARALDTCLGDYLDRLGEDDHLMLVSDHGFGDLRGDVYLNAWLVEKGYLSFDPAKVRAFAPPALDKNGDPRHGWHHRLHASDAAPLPGDEDIRRGRFDARYKAWDTVDWSRTRAYASGLFGNMWINRKGREPEGIVEAGRECESLLDELAERLADLRHPDDGERLVSRVERGDDLYWGPHVERAPDLVITLRDYAYMTRGATEFHENRLVGPVVVGHTGNHRLHGVVGLVGPSAARGNSVEAHILDVAPTILYLLGSPIPSNLDRPAPSAALLDAAALAARPPLLGASVAPRDAADQATTAHDMSEVRKRLEGLGYLA